MSKDRVIRSERLAKINQTTRNFNKPPVFAFTVTNILFLAAAKKRPICGIRFRARNATPNNKTLAYSLLKQFSQQILPQNTFTLKTNAHTMSPLCGSLFRIAGLSAVSITAQVEAMCKPTLAHTSTALEQSTQCAKPKPL
jgi:hypothetical protein